jgi:hypothetical protein
MELFNFVCERRLFDWLLVERMGKLFDTYIELKGHMMTPGFGIDQMYRENILFDSLKELKRHMVTHNGFFLGG